MGYAITNRFFGRNQRSKEAEIMAAAESETKSREAFDTDAGRRRAEFRKAALRGETFETTDS